MKKLKLKALSLGAREILSREQLRTINGGCSTDSDCNAGGYCQNGNCWANWYGSDTGGGTGGSGSGGGHSCPPTMGGPCDWGNGPGHLEYPQVWNSVTGTCEADLSGNVRCVV